MGRIDSHYTSRLFQRWNSTNGSQGPTRSDAVNRVLGPWTAPHETFLVISLKGDCSGFQFLDLPCCPNPVLCLLFSKYQGWNFNWALILAITTSRPMIWSMVREGEERRWSSPLIEPQPYVKQLCDSTICDTTTDLDVWISPLTQPHWILKEEELLHLSDFSRVKFSNQLSRGYIVGKE